jgi:ureidoacrylate peracid hydrolase
MRIAGGATARVQTLAAPRTHSTSVAGAVLAARRTTRDSRAAKKHRETTIMPEGANLARAALLIVNMQNDFLHPDGSFGRLAKEKPIDLPFLVATIPHVRRLADAFRAASRPVVYIAHVLKSDYSDAAFPYWRLGLDPSAGNLTHCVEGTWGAQIIDELNPKDGEIIHREEGVRGVRQYAARHDPTEQRRYDLCGCRSHDVCLRLQYRARRRRI